MDDPHAEVEIKAQLKPRGSVALIVEFVEKFLKLAQVKLCISCRFMKIFSEISYLETKTGHQVHILKSIICTHPTSAGSHVFCYLSPKAICFGCGMPFIQILLSDIVQFLHDKWQQTVFFQLALFSRIGPDIAFQLSSVCCC